MRQKSSGRRPAEFSGPGQRRSGAAGRQEGKAERLPDARPAAPRQRAGRPGGVGPDPKRPRPEAAGAGRALAIADRKIEKLEEALRDHEVQKRHLLDRIRELEGTLRSRKDAADELAELRSEIRELTRANREHVKRNDAINGENARLRAGLRGPAR
jgi:hypothetical protein